VSQAPVVLHGWHRWFAWRPVFVPAVGWVWLRTVERQYTSQWHTVPVCVPNGADPWQTWTTEYRPITKESRS